MERGDSAEGIDHMDIRHLAYATISGLWNHTERRLGVIGCLLAILFPPVVEVVVLLDELFQGIVGIRPVESVRISEIEASAEIFTSLSSACIASRAARQRQRQERTAGF